MEVYFVSTDADLDNDLYNSFDTFGPSEVTSHNIGSQEEAWLKISKGNSYGFICTSDIRFREDGLMRTKFTPEYIEQRLHESVPEVRHSESVLHLGSGTMLPIHINIKSESLMRAQEKHHALDINAAGFGTLNDKSVFATDFSYTSYIIGPEAALKLLNKEIKTSSKPVHVIAPLMTYRIRINEQVSLETPVNDKTVPNVQ